MELGAGQGVSGFNRVEVGDGSGSGYSHNNSYSLRGSTDSLGSGGGGGLDLRGSNGSGGVGFTGKNVLKFRSDRRRSSGGKHVKYVKYVLCLKGE